MNWCMIHTAARQTGRTTRMLMEAQAAVEEGRRVYVLVLSQAEIERMKRRLPSHIAQQISWETPLTLSISRIDWRNMRPSVNAWPKTHLCVDHAVLERELHDQLEALFRHF